MRCTIITTARSLFSFGSKNTRSVTALENHILWLSMSLSFRSQYSLSKLRLIINLSITCSTSIPLLSPARRHSQSEVTFAVTDLLWSHSFLFCSRKFWGFRANSVPKAWKLCHVSLYLWLQKKNEIVEMVFLMHILNVEGRWFVTLDPVMWCGILERDDLGVQCIDCAVFRIVTVHLALIIPCCKTGHMYYFATGKEVIGVPDMW